MMHFERSYHIHKVLCAHIFTYLWLTEDLFFVGVDLEIRFFPQSSSTCMLWIVGL